MFLVTFKKKQNRPFVSKRMLEKCSKKSIFISDKYHSSRTFKYESFSSVARAILEQEMSDIVLYH